MITNNTLNNVQKSNLLKRRIRNAIAHCKYNVEIRTDDGEINKDGDVWFVFEDMRQNEDDKIKIEINLPVFGNLIEKAGAHCMRKLRS